MDKLGMLLPLIIPLIGTLFIINKKLISDKHLTKVVAITVIVNFFCVIYSLYYAGDMSIHVLKVNAFLDIYFKVDQLTRVFALLAAFLWVLTSFYAFEYMTHEKRHRQFYAFFVLTLAVIMGVAYSGNMFTLYAYYELLTLCTLPLVIHPNTSEALQSGKKYIIYSFGGATLVVLGMMMIYAVTGHMNFQDHGILNTGIFQGNESILRWSYLAMFLGFGVKAALVPFHSWLPNAMVAPTPVSALLHAVAVVKSGVFALVRTTYFLFGASLVSILGVAKFLIPLVIVTIVMGSLLALHQDHLKKRLAYSTISQLGYILLGILMLTPNGLLGAMLHMINHAVIKITLFFSVGAITHMTHHKYIHQIKGIGKKMPITLICFSVASISLVGIPPTNGFVSKWFLGLGALNVGNLFYIIFLLVSAFFTAGYLFPIPVTAFFADIKDDIESMDPSVVAEDLEDEVSVINVSKNGMGLVEKLDPPRLMLYPILILTVVIVTLGIFPNPIISFLDVVVQDAF